MDIPGENKTLIRRLSVKCGKSDPLLQRLRFERLFGKGNFLPAGFPSKAIICIKKLQDPAPYTLSLFQKDSGFNDAWEKKVAGRIEDLFRRAFRPINESVPALAESVVFLDKGELLACLGKDWCRGILNQNWWWRSLFPNLDTARAVARIWIESVEYVPVALHFLAKRKTAADFVQKLQPEETARLLKQILETFGLKKIQAALFEPLTEKEKHNFRNISSERKQSFSKQISFEYFRLSEIGFEEGTETRHQKLNFEKEILLRTGLTLARAPHIARSEKFARQIREFKIETDLRLAKISEESETILLPDAKPELQRREIEKKITPRDIKQNRADFSKPEGAPENPPEKKAKIIFQDFEQFENLKAKPSESKTGLKFQKPAEKMAKKTEEVKVERSKTEISFEKEKPEKRTTIYQNKLEKFSSIFSTDETEEIENEEFDTVIRTGFGGVFYLLNLGLYLKLYRDFSEPSGDEVDLNIWDFVGLLSRDFLGKKIEKDEVWKLLKYLAGREKDENFGDDFDPADAWRIPTEWLKTFRSATKWSWSKNKNRLIVRHSENFNVLDVPLKADFKVQLESELKIYRQYFSEITESKKQELIKESLPRRRYIKNLSKFSERRLIQALNIKTHDQLNEILFRKTATVAVSATHLEVTFSLADLSLAVRLSGLDRNPGWIPAAGKYVEFHFV